jgi:hypothetical protein
MVILMNVLDLRTYQEPKESFGINASDWSTYDLNNIPVVERYEIAYARGRCFDILNWFFTSYELYNTATGLAIDGFKEVAMAHLARQAYVIHNYKTKALKDRLDDGTLCGVKALDLQIKLCFEGRKEVLQIMPTKTQLEAEDDCMSMAWPSPEKYHVRKLVTPLVHKCKATYLLGLNVPY